MPDTIIESVLSGKLSPEVLAKWLNDDLKEDAPEESALLCCNRSEFVAYFLSYLRNQTDKILQTNTNALQLLQHQNTPEKMFRSQHKHRRSISEPNTSDPDGERQMDSLNVTTEKTPKSPSKERSSHKKQGRRVKTKLFLEAEPLHKSRSHEHNLNRSASSSRTDSDESRLSSGVERLVISSTPMKNGVRASEYPCLPVTSPVTPHSEANHSRSISRHSSYSHLPKEHHERCDTPRVSHRSRISNPEKSMPSLGDYILNAQPSKSSKKKKASKNLSNDSNADGSQSKIELDLSNNEMFPEIGARRQSNSLHSDREKRRIKPTNLDGSGSKRSFSLNSFNSETFQQTSPLALEQNSAFKYQKLQPKELANSFEVERNILKQERHKLMEKFNILNTTVSPKMAVTPQIKISRKDSGEQLNLIKADVNKMNFRDKIDLLIDIYNNMWINNYILSISSEVYFLISILLSRQYEEDYLAVEVNLRLLEEDDNNNLNLSEYLLRSIHNCSYFAVKSLWKQRCVLELMLDKNSLKLLGENKRVRSFSPDLAKFLLNLYGLKCEAESFCVKDDKCGHNFNNGIVCFNFETDNADNFPSVLSFHNFKKQRDLFYEILRWWSNPEKQNSSSGCARTSLRSRVKSLLSLAVAPANHAHLARLLRDHIVAECVTNAQESKLSKLQRRLLGPSTSGPEPHRLPKFTPREQFYKDLIMFAENESFRTHLRDALATELLTLDATVGFSDDRANATTNDTSKEYLLILKKLRLLAKFLGFLIALPYTQVPVEYTMKTGVPCGGGQVQNFTPPKEKVFESDVAVRNYNQPIIDLKDTLKSAQENHRLTITLPWLAQYLAMLDYTTLRVKYYTDLLKSIFDIYNCVLRTDYGNASSKGDAMKRNTVIFLKLCLGWLFDMPQFPQELYYETCLRVARRDIAVLGNERTGDDLSVDLLELVDENVLFEVCPYLKDFNTLLLTAQPSVENKDMGSFRHITPVTMTLNATDRIKNKEKEIQARLEEELLKSQPSSTRRVLEMVTERVTSATVKELSASLLQQARGRARIEGFHATNLWRQSGASTNVLLTTLQNIYSMELRSLHTKASELARSSVSSRTGMALHALLASGSVKAPLEAVSRRASLTRIHKWIDDNWSSVAILCKDIQEEMKNHLVLGESVLPTTPLRRDPVTDTDSVSVHVSPATTIILLKEQICQLLHYEPCEDISGTLELARACCSATNMFAHPSTTAALHQLTCDLAIVYISRCPDGFTHHYLQKLNAVWNECCPDRRKNRSPSSEDNGSRTRAFHEETHPPTPVTSDEEPQDKNDRKCPFVIVKHNQDKPAKCESAEPRDSLLQHFDRTLCPRNINLLSSSRCDQSTLWERVSELLVYLLRNDYMTEDSLTEQCLAVYRQDWSQSVLESLSQCMRSVSQQWGRSSTGKFTLFLDFLAEYCNDMDYEQDEAVVS